MTQQPTIDRLLYSAADSPETVLIQLRQYPELAGQQDAHGYSLVHAAASYGHVELLRALIQEFKVDVNIKDEESETALFNVEDIRMAKELISLGIDVDEVNGEGQTAAEKFDDDDEQPKIAEFLRTSKDSSTSNAAAAPEGTSTDVHALPPLPSGMDISIGTMSQDEAGEAPDPELRRRIEELATRPDFHDESGQKDLRDLVSQVVTGISSEDGHSSARRRVD